MDTYRAALPQHNRFGIGGVIDRAVPRFQDSSSPRDRLDAEDVCSP